MTARRLGSVLVLLLLCTGAQGCTTFVSRSPVNDFLFKDYDLPDYDPDEAEFRRERRKIQPEPMAGALGGMAGTLAGGRVKAWKTSASPALGGLAGAAIGSAFSEAEANEPLPEAFEGLVLALPIVATDPNLGPTVGLLPVGVFKERDRLTNIFSPDITWNPINGVGGMFRMRRYFKNDSNLVLDAGTSNKGNDDYEVIYNQRRVGPKQILFYRGRFVYRTTLAERFFGIGNETDEDDESSYVFRKTFGTAMLGVQLPFNLSLEFLERIASYKVGPGRLTEEDDEVPSTKAKFRDVIGVNDGRLTLVTHRIKLIYDSRDSRGAPTEGVYGEFAYEISDGALGSEVGFQRFSLALTFLIPKFNKRFTTAVHFAGWIMTGDSIPFYELTSVGGKETNRGYGTGRWVDQNGFVLNFEERINVAYFNAADTNLILQLAPFVDIGRVFEEGEGFTFKDAHVSVGSAIRLVIPDSELVVSIDVGFSDEGNATFVSLNYPW